MPIKHVPAPNPDQRILGGFLRWSAMTVFCGAVLLGTARRSTAATLTVTTASDAVTHTGTSLRDALGTAAPGDTINFGIPNESGVLLAQGPLSVTKTVSITGPGALFLEIRAQPSNRVMNVSAGATVSISGLSMVGNGYVAGDGGLILNNGLLTLNGVSMLSGNSNRGGGVYSGKNAASLAVINSTFNYCRANSYGGAIYSAYAPLTVRNSTLSGNYSSYGSAIYVDKANATIQNSTIAYNTGTGAVAGYGTGTVKLQSSVLSGNGANDLTNNGNTSYAYHCLFQSTPVLSGGSANNYPGTVAQLSFLQFNGGQTETCQPKAGSPVLGKGYNPLGLATDQRGAPRAVAGKVDIGAVQLQPAQSLIVTNAHDSGPGSLRQCAASVFDTPSTITFDPMYFSAATPRTIPVLNNEILLNGPATITGPGAAVATVDGGNATRVLGIRLSQSAKVTISGLTLAHGAVSTNYYAAGLGLGNIGGAGISSYCSLILDTVTVTGCNVSGSIAFGGGILAYGGLTLKTCNISSNSAVSTAGTLFTPFQAIGGGIFHIGAKAARKLVVQNSVISGNTVSSVSASGPFAIALAGGVFAFEPAIQNSTISGNTVTATGGTIRCFAYAGGITGAYTYLQGSTVSGNTVSATSNAPYCYARAGGVGTGFIYSAGYAAVIQNSTISSNTVFASGTKAQSAGGGISAYKYLYLANSTVAYNVAKNGSGLGGGIYFAKNGISCSIVSSIIAKNSHNSAAPISDDIYSKSLNLFGTNNLIGDGTFQTVFKDGVNSNQVGSAAAPIDPKISPLKNHGGLTATHILTAGSPAIDKGLNTVDINNAPNKLQFDQRGSGFPRQLGAAVDIGATEFEAVPPTATMNPGQTLTSPLPAFTFTINFADNVAIDLLSLGNTNILVTGPNGFSQMATFVSATPSTDGPSIVATYSITPPGGGLFSPLNDGTYTVAIQPNQVFDTSGNPVAAANLGTLSVLVSFFLSPPSATPNPTIVGLDVQFSAQASGAPPVNYLWNFGDGTSALGPNPVHAFAAVGTYTVTVTAFDASGGSVAATLTVVVIDGNADSDGDGFSNGVEAQLGSDPNNPASTPLNLPPPKAGGKVDAKHVKISLSFGVKKADKIFVSGTLPVPSDFLTAGQAVIVDVGGLVRGFILDQSGTARTSTPLASSVNDTFRLRGSKGGSRIFKVTMGADTFQGVFAVEPTPNQVLNNAKAGTFAKQVRVAIYFNGSKYESLISGHYRVTRHGVTGVFTK